MYLPCGAQSISETLLTSAELSAAREKETVVYSETNTQPCFPYAVSQAGSLSCTDHQSTLEQLASGKEAHV